MPVSVVCKYCKCNKQNSFQREKIEGGDKFVPTLQEFHTIGPHNRSI